MNWMSSISITGHKSKLVTDSLHLNNYLYYIMNQSFVSVPCFVFSSFYHCGMMYKLNFKLLQVDTEQPMKQNWM